MLDGISLDFAGMIGPVARRLLGEPNDALSSEVELRFGRNGSLSVKLAGDGAGTWFDHEGRQGGGVLDLVRRETRLVDREAIEWLHREVGPEIKAQASRGTSAPVRKSSLGRIVATYDYHDASGAHAFQVVRYEPKTFRQRRDDGAGTVRGGQRHRAACTRSAALLTIACRRPSAALASPSAMTVVPP